VPAVTTPGFLFGDTPVARKLEDGIKVAVERSPHETSGRVEYGVTARAKTISVWLIMGQ